MNKFLWTSLLLLSSVSGQPGKAAERKQENAKQIPLTAVTEESQSKPASGQTDQPKNNPKPTAWYIALERPDWWLVIIAGLTGCVIAWQSWETRKAAQGAKENAVTAVAQLEFIKSKERAQLRVELGQPDFSYDAELKGYPVNFRVTLDGTTRAYVLQGSILAYLGKSKRKEGGSRTFGIPRNLTPENSPYDGQTPICSTASFPEAETDTNKFYFAHTGKEYTLFVDGQIWYRDIFGEEWVLQIDRYWDALVQSWEPVGSGSEDVHKKVDTSRRDHHKKTS